MSHILWKSLWGRN